MLLRLATASEHAPRDPVMPVPTRHVDPRPAHIASTELAATSDKSTARSTEGILAGAAMVFALIMLGIAAVPVWIIRSERAAILLEHWRVQIAASGASALVVAGVVFLMGSSGI
jgi:hypothetical protein